MDIADQPLKVRAESKKAEVTRGPFDPGGQPERATSCPLELGFFAWNISSGLAASKAVLANPARYQNYWQWPIASRLVALADEIGFDYQVPFGQWAGNAGPSAFNEASLDFATAAAATVPITKRMKLFSSVHVGYRFHPLHIAKIGACIDSISGGRWALNIIAGQKDWEYRAFGFKTKPSSEERYGLADEFTTLMKYLWTSDSPIDFEGEYFQAYGAYINPQPTSRPRPTLMNAGQSEAGLDFACKHVDWVFVAPPTGLVADYRATAEKARAKAASYSREIRVACMAFGVMDATDELAAETLAWIESEIDDEATMNFVGGMAGSSSQTQYGLEEKGDDEFAGLGRDMYMRSGVGMTAARLVGGYETVAEQMRELHEAGVDSIVVSFWDPLKGLHEMEDQVFPILRKMGLRR